MPTRMLCLDRLARLALSPLLCASLSGCFLFPGKDCDQPACMPPPDARVAEDMAAPDLLVPPDLREPPPDLLVPPDLAPECVNEAGCAAGLACKAGSCVSCVLHADCESKTCDVYQSTAKGPGKCLTTGDVVYADNANGTCVGTHAGTLADPVCGIDQGLMVLGARPALRLLPSTVEYGSNQINNQKVTLYGPAGQGGKARLGGAAQQAALAVVNKAEVVADGVELSTALLYGLNCFGGTTTAVTLRRSAIIPALTPLPSAALIDDCKLTLDRVLISGNKGALAITGTRDFSITNSFFINNAAPVSASPIDIDNTTATVRLFRFNTVANNTSPNKAGINCNGGLQIADSIIVANATSGGAQLTAMCTASATSLLGDGDMGNGGVKKTPEFTNKLDAVSGVNIAYALNPAGTVNLSDVIDKVANPTATDYFGKVRPGGTAADVGAHEAN